MIKICHIFFFLTSILLLACTDKSNKGDRKSEFIGQDKATISEAYSFKELKKSDPIKNKVAGDFIFSIDVLSSLDFLRHKGAQIEEKDSKDLENESTIILEITGKSLYEDIFESKSLTKTKDDAVQYLIGDIQKDFTVEQADVIYEPTTVIYEGRIGEKNKIRVLFLINKLNREKSYRIIYNDHLFGRGLIKFIINKNLES